MKRIKMMIGVVAFLLSGSAYAGDYVVMDGTIITVANTGPGQPNFAVKVTGGTGVCSGQWVTFPEADASNPGAYQRAYSTALLAFSTSLKVRIYNYVDTTCNHGSYIEVNK